MRLNALLVSRDDSCIHLLQAAFDQLGIEQSASHNPAQAMGLLVEGNYSAVILDFDLPGAAQIARMLSIASPTRRPVVFGLASSATPAADVCQTGMNFVLYKPFSLDQALRPLRAWQIFAGDRRQTPRHKMEAIVYLQLGVAAMPALVLDMSESGLALRAPEPLPPLQNLPLRFVLPGTTNIVEAIGEVIWADDLGRVGMVFAELPPASRSRLKAWVAGCSVKPKDAPRTALSTEYTRGASPVLLNSAVER